MKHVGMSQSPTPATRNDIARRLKPPEVTTFAAVAIGTAIGSPECPHRARTAGGCERKHKSNVERTQVHPQSPKIKQEPFATHLEKKVRQSPINSCRLRLCMYFGMFPAVVGNLHSDLQGWAIWARLDLPSGVHYKRVIFQCHV